MTSAGSISIFYALMIPVVFGAAGIGLDYSRAAQKEARCRRWPTPPQSLRPASFRWPGPIPKRLPPSPRTTSPPRSADAVVGTKVDTQALTVRVDLKKDVEPTIAKIIWPGKIHLTASATAGMSGGLPLCLIGLDTMAPGTIKLEQNALLTAPACVVYSNSKSPQGLKSMDDAVLKAGFICSAGGKVQTKNTNYSPAPQTDCPVISDPLSERKPPRTASCDYKNQVIDGTTTTLKPGVYCGGLTITQWRASDARGRDLIRSRTALCSWTSMRASSGDNVAINMLGAGAQPDLPGGDHHQSDGPEGAGRLLGYSSTTTRAARLRPCTRNRTTSREGAARAPDPERQRAQAPGHDLHAAGPPHHRRHQAGRRPVRLHRPGGAAARSLQRTKSRPEHELRRLRHPVPRGVGPYGGKVLLTN